MFRELVQLEEMITFKLMRTINGMQTEKERVLFCVYCVRTYGYPEYHITQKFLQRNGEKLRALLGRLDELSQNSTMTIEDRA